MQTFSLHALKSCCARAGLLRKIMAVAGGEFSRQNNVPEASRDDLQALWESERLILLRELCATAGKHVAHALALAPLEALTAGR